MTWRADRIYTKPRNELIKYLKTIDGISDEIFLVDNLEGIRSQWTRNLMFSDRVDENNKIKHSLPKDGLLVLKPKLYKTGYDKDDNDEFWNKYSNYPNDKWNFIKSISDKRTKLNIELELTENQERLVTFLKFLNEKFTIPFVYYYCLMWGGDIEEEYSIVFNNSNIIIYKYDYENEKNFKIINDEKTHINSTVLQSCLKYFNLDLKNYFFALHEGSFDWKRYHIK